MKKTYFPVIICLILVFTLSFGCAKKKESETKFGYNRDTTAPFAYPDVRFAVISDLHVYDHSLGTSGSAFEKTMHSDRKLLLDSIDLLDFAINHIINADVKFVLVSGDLTKDGELVNHRIAAEKLRKLRAAGINVYVVPGNHDISNPVAVRYIDDRTENVTTINPEEFANIYRDFGYNSAIYRDSDSLSYVVEPVEGLWLLAIDSCRHRENTPETGAITSGSISQKTADWIDEVLRNSISRRKAVMAMQHHGFMEHWNGHAKLHPKYIVKDFKAFAESLASYNVRLAFSGHYHAQDITKNEFGDKFIYDIETGSLVTAPCPVRILDIKNNVVDIKSNTIVDKIYPGTGFAANGIAFVKKTVVLEALDTLKKYKVSGKDADYIADAVGEAFTAHYFGDEDPALRPPFDRKKLGLWGKFIYSQQQYILDGLWVDLPPADNNVSLRL